jgi:hypothetical protein
MMSYTNLREQTPPAIRPLPHTGYAEDTHRFCARCGERIGLYEPLWRRNPDCTLVKTRLAMRQHEPQDQSQPQIWHIQCLETDVNRSD